VNRILNSKIKYKNAKLWNSLFLNFAFCILNFSPIHPFTVSFAVSMKRRKAREYVLQFLFQSDFGNKSAITSSLKQFWADKEKDAEVKKFATEIIKGALSNLDEIDSVINKSAEHWAMQRMAAVDRNILRFAVYELLHRKDIPEAVTMNEAIEIAKKYSTAESAAFINGILDKIARGITSQQKKA